MEPLILWQQKWSQDLFIPTYLFLGGLTAGLFVVAVLADLGSLALRRLETPARLAALTAVPVLALGGLVLTVHLGKPERGLGFPLFFTNYNSWMTRGGWVLGAAAPLVVLHAALWYLRLLPGLRRALGVVALPLVAFLGAYTGLLLSGAGYVPVWSGAHLPLLFLTSGLTAGTAACGLVLLGAMRWGGAGPEQRPVVRALGLIVAALIAVEAWELRGFTTYLETRAPDKAFAEDLPGGRFVAPMGSRLAYRYLTGGEGYPWRLFSAEGAEPAEAARGRRTLAPWFWIGVVGLGLALPLLLTVVEAATLSLGWLPSALAAGAKFLSVLAGGYLLRVVIVWGGDLKAPLPFPPALWQVPGFGG
jgi:formate-dependent nitrite reductase membrane component NrfD